MQRFPDSHPVRLRHRSRVWLAVRIGWLTERLGRHEYRRRPDWRAGWGGAFNGQQFRQRMFAELAMRVPLVAIIETGTFRGTITEYFRRVTELSIHSFEANPRHYGFARAHLRSLPDVYLHRCDSRLGLPRLASSRILPPGPVFFYLDAHGFGDLPLAQEVDLAFRYWPEAVVMIDDFAVTNDPGYGFEDYGAGQALTLEYLAANGILPRAICFPACAASAETGARRGCVVLAGTADVAQRLDAADTLRRWAGWQPPANSGGYLPPANAVGSVAIYHRQNHVRSGIDRQGRARVRGFPNWRPSGNLLLADQQRAGTHTESCRRSYSKEARTMKIKLGTFNLNNLFSRFNFQASISQLQSGNATIEYKFTSNDDIAVRKFKGSLIKAKSARDTNKIAARILDPAMDLDVLAVQEVENIQILREFNETNLGGRYPYKVLIEGNDPRFIDVGVLSKLPIGPITSFQTAVHDEDPGKRVFGRDLLGVTILSQQRTKSLFTVYNTHLKSHYGDDDDNGQGKVRNDTRRRRQAEMVQEIIGKQMRTDSRYAVVGDMNDPPDSVFLQGLRTIDGQPMFDALAAPTEVGTMRDETNPADNPQTTAWTHRFKPSGQPPSHELFDQIWLSPGLQPKFQQAFIGRRSHLTGDGSDHDPAWVELDL